jgi:hypothetical protein
MVIGCGMRAGMARGSCVGKRKVEGGKSAIFGAVRAMVNGLAFSRDALAERSAGASRLNDVTA